MPHGFDDIGEFWSNVSKQNQLGEIDERRTNEEWQAMLSIKFVSDEVRGLGHFSTEFHQSHQKYKRACSMSTKLILQAS